MPRQGGGWQREAGGGEGRRHVYPASTRGPGWGGTPLGGLRSLGGPAWEAGVGGWRGVPAVKKGMGSTNQILEEVVVTPKPQIRERGWPRPRVCRHQDVVQTETLPQTSKRACSTPRLFSNTISGKNTLKS